MAYASKVSGQGRVIQWAKWTAAQGFHRRYHVLQLPQNICLKNTFANVLVHVIGTFQ
jgi:hypothetical protein